MRNLIVVTLILMVLFGALPGLGAVLRVEKDGSGDFTVIQDAVDAAENGDTIQIGQGRFDDYLTDPQWGNFRVWVRDGKSLHFVGSGPQSTVIGPEEYGGGSSDWDWGISCRNDPDLLSIEGIRFENLSMAAVDTDAENFEIENCIFQSCRRSCGVYGHNSTSILNCEFYDGPEDYVISLRAEDIYIFNIIVQNCHKGVYVQASPSNNLLIEDSVFDGGGEALSAMGLFDCSGLVRNCQISNFNFGGISLTRVSHITLENNIIEGIRRLDGYQGAGLLMDRGESLTMIGNIISSADNCFWITRSFDETSIHGNHFLRDPGSNDLYIRVRDDWAYFEEHVDFSGNYWGTTDIDEISEWIFDGYDSEEVTMYIEFLPLADGPISTESKTLDGVKALYRD